MTNLRRRIHCNLRRLRNRRRHDCVSIESEIATTYSTKSPNHCAHVPVVASAVASVATSVVAVRHLRVAVEKAQEKIVAVDEHDRRADDEATDGPSFQKRMYLSCSLSQHSLINVVNVICPFDLRTRLSFRSMFPSSSGKPSLPAVTDDEASLTSHKWPPSLLQQTLKPLIRGHHSVKRALQSDASYFAECHLQGIQHEEASEAASSVQEMHQKWWVATRRRKRLKTNEDDAMIEKPSPSSLPRFDDTVGTLPMTNSLMVPRVRSTSPHELIATLKRALQGARGDAHHPSCQPLLRHLTDLQSQDDIRWKLGEPSILDAHRWKLLTKPLYSELQGQASVSDNQMEPQPVYTLGRLAFDMFRPTHLLCSISHITNRIQLSSNNNQRRPRSFPARLPRHNKPQLRDYDLIVDIVVQAHQKRHARDDFMLTRPIAARLTNYGYCLPDPQTPQRLSVWFSGGTLECLHTEDLAIWKELLDQRQASRRDLRAQAQVLAARFLLGAQLADHVDEQGKLTYILRNPIGGHGSVYIDSLYCDETFRVVQGHNGSLYVFEAEES